MIVRSIDVDNDWNFGKGKNDYLKNNKAIEQSIKTRLQSFLGDCFFSLDAGIDWFNLLGSKNKAKLELDVRAVIMNTDGVTKLISSSTLVNAQTRRINMTYVVETIYTNNNPETLIADISSFLLTEDGDVLVTEDGSGIEAG